MGIKKLKMAIVFPPLLPLLANILYLITPTYLYAAYKSRMELTVLEPQGGTPSASKNLLFGNYFPRFR